MWQALTKDEKLKYKELAKMGKFKLKNINCLIFVDKERYLTELRDLTKCNKTLDRPKKPLTPYMLFVRDVSNSSRIPNIEFDLFSNRRGPKWCAITRTSQHLTS